MLFDPLYAYIINLEKTAPYPKSINNKKEFIDKNIDHNANSFEEVLVTMKGKIIMLLPYLTK